MPEAMGNPRDRLWGERMGTLRNDETKAAAEVRGRLAIEAEAQQGTPSEAAAYLDEGPSFRRKPWVRALSVVMSFLLAFTMFDTTGLGPILSTASAAPQAQQDAAQPADPAADEKEPDVADDGDAVAQPDDAAGEAEENSPSDSQPEAAEDEPADEGPSQPTEEQIAAAAAALLPEGLQDAEDVLPAATDGTDDVSAYLQPSLSLFDAPLSGDGQFAVQSTRLQAEVSLGNLSDLLEGGYLAGARKDDRLVLSFDVPYLYENADGQLSSTLSEERWRVLRGTVDAPAAAQGPRVALYAPELPEGWSAWQEHDGRYLQLDGDALASGVSGRVVLRFDGDEGKLDAETELPLLEFGFEGTTDEEAQATVSFGYEVHSYTPRATDDNPDPRPLTGDVIRATAGTFSLVNSEIDLGVSVGLEPVGTPVAADGAGYLASVATVSVEGSQSQTFVRAVALGASFPADWEGRHGLPLETLMANVADGDGTVRINDDADGAAAPTASSACPEPAACWWPT